MFVRMFASRVNNEKHLHKKEEKPPFEINKFFLEKLTKSIFALIILTSNYLETASSASKK